MVPLLQLLTILGLTQGRGPVREITGTWRGNAVCANRAKDTSCRDEGVIYDVDTLGAARGNVTLRAHKLVNRTQQFMYALQLRFVPATHTWQSDFITSSFHGRWEYTVKAGTMTGRLIELPSKRLVRRVTVRRGPPLKRGV